jgi:hypothetical protein
MRLAVATLAILLALPVAAAEIWQVRRENAAIGGRGGMSNKTTMVE